MLKFLLKTGYKSERLLFIPLCGFKGDNLLFTYEDPSSSWYKGPTLVQGLDRFEAPARSVDGPFRISVQDCYKGGLGGDITISGRVESGSVQIGDQLLALPINENGVVKGILRFIPAIELNEVSSKYAVCGDRISISLNGFEVQQIGAGTILCEPEYPLKVTQNFNAQIMVLDINSPLTIGVPVVLHYIGSAEPAFLKVLAATIDKNGATIKKNPRFLCSGATALVEIQVGCGIPMESFQNCKGLGRFTLRSASVSVAVGIVIELL